MQKEPWWVRHRTIGFAVGLVVFVFGYLTLGTVSFFEQVWMNAKGFDWDPINGGYIHRKTGT